MLPDTKLHGILAAEFTPSDSLGWRPQWLTRYSSIYKNRGIVHSKGYTIRLSRSLRNPIINAATSEII
ncbi:unnamed protein product [Protopolystoma xenopodis]|uniref:Uncharacterized protein n=1 Tax=Protopolystoma xenopodis TaxID=117903 RepID=A0A3S5AGC9_9PLAT|nr:unnamed protein product [Protopolystoma xenopodis]